jgi:Inner membrane protein YgaP-like, transmembrane domain
MNAERITRGVAGVFVLLSVSLGYFVNPWWFAFTAFVGLNLLQSAFTDWCPMLALLRKLTARKPAVV